MKDSDDSRPEKEGNDIDTGQHIEEETASKASRVDSDPDSRSESEHVDSVNRTLDAPAVKRHKRPRSHVWKRQFIKEKRLKGESYKNATGQKRQPKIMGPPCTSQHCLRSKKQSCELLSEEERMDIFNNFWSMPSWETRKLYIQTLLENVPIKQKKGSVSSRRKTSLSNHLQLAESCRIPVCKILFC